MESELLKKFFILRKGLLHAIAAAIDHTREIIEPFRILRDEGKEFFSYMGLDKEKTEEEFQKYQERLLKKFGIHNG